jgi:hypothetical protein
LYPEGYEHKNKTRDNLPNIEIDLNAPAFDDVNTYILTLYVFYSLYRDFNFGPLYLGQMAEFQQKNMFS